MGLIEDLTALIASYQSDGHVEPPSKPEVAGNEEVDASANTDVKTVEGEPGKGESTPDTNNEAGTKTMEASTVTPTEIQAPAPAVDAVIVTAEDMVEESVAMQLAAFYQRQEKTDATLATLMLQVSKLEARFTELDRAIDVAAKTTPGVKDIDTLLNMI